MTIDVKRGTTFRDRVRFPESLLGWVVTAEIRTRAQNVPLEVRVLDADPTQVEISLAADLTAHLPLRLLSLDVRAVLSGAEAAHTETVHINIIERITHG